MTEPARPTRTVLLFSLVALTACLASPAARARTWEWTGAGDGIDLFNEANWAEADTGGEMPPFTMEPGFAVNHDLVVDGGMPGGSEGAPPDLVLGAGSLEIRGGGVRLSEAAAAGIRNGTIAVAGGELRAHFIGNGATLSIAAGTVVLHGGGDPINNSTIDFPAGSSGLLHLPAESVEDFVVEHLAKITLDGEPAVTGADPATVEPGDTLSVASDGGTGSLVTPIATGPFIERFDADPGSVPPGAKSTLSWTIDPPFDRLRIEPGIGDVAGFTTNGVGSLEVVPAATTTYTLVVERGSRRAEAQATIRVSGATTLRLSEILAVNRTGLEDEDGANSDWIEIENAGPSPADLGGWFLTDDPDEPGKWAFPDGVAIAPGGRLVVFASGKDRRDPAGELHTGFRLTGDGEFLALVEPDGETFADAFAPSYPPLPGDVSFGRSGADGALVYFTTPTPGAANTVGTSELGPVIRDATDRAAPPNRDPAHGPLDEAIIVEARVLAADDPVASVSLAFRIGFEDEETRPMHDDGIAPDATPDDGVFTATVPLEGLAPGEMIRWRIEARGTGGASSRSPEFPSQTESPEYFGTMAADPSVESSLPVLHWFVRSAAAANTRGGTRCSLFFDGEFLDNVFVRLRGGSSAGLAKKSYKFDFNPGFKFRFHPDEGRVEEFNLNTTYTDKTYLRQSLGFDLYDACGAPGSISFPMRVQQNGGFFSVAAFVEQPDDDLLDREDLDRQGALYKMFNTFTSATSGVEKKTRRWENNADLADLINAITRSSGPDLDIAIFDRIDVPRTLNYLAGNALVQNNDSMAKNYYLYRDSDGSGEWFPIPWDLDLTFGRHYMTDDNIRGDTLWADEDYVLGGSGRNVPISPSHPFTGMRELPGNRNWNRLIDKLFESERFTDLFRRRFRTIVETLLQPPGTPRPERFIESRIDAQAARIGADAAADYDRWPKWGQRQTMDEAIAILERDYLDVRRVHFFETHLEANADAYPTPQAFSARLPGAQPAAPAIRFGAFEASPPSGNQDEEFVELVNENGFAVDVSGWRLDGGIRHTFREGTVIEAMGSLIASPRVAAFRGRTISPTGGEGRHVQGDYQGQLSSRGETVTLTRRDGSIADTLVTEANPSALQQSLRITELHYAPVGGPGFEFVELRNTGDATLDLAGAAFTAGIAFVFPEGATLAPGAYGLLVGDAAAFASRYGPGLPVLGTFAGALENGGEQVTVRDAAGENVLSFEYDGDWFGPARGGGFSIGILDEGAPWDAWDQPGSWALSGTPGGSPGAANPPASEAFEGWVREHFTAAEQEDPAVSGLLADASGDGIANLLKYAFGLDPRIASPGGLPAFGATEDGEPALTFRRRLRAVDLAFVPEGSADLESWTPLHEPVGAPTDNGDGTETVTFTGMPDGGDPPSGAWFLRVRVVRAGGP